MKNIILFCSLLIFIFGCNSTQESVTNIENNTTSVSNTQTNINKVQNVNGDSVSSDKNIESKFDVDAVINNMGRRIMKSGSSQDAGVWVVYRVNISEEKNKDQQQALALAEIRAKRSIGEWMKSTISKKSSMQSSRKVDGEEIVSTAVYNSLTKVNSEAFLRGVTFHSFTKNENGSLDAIFYATGKVADRTAELEAQLKAAPPGVVRAIGFGIIVNEKISPAKQQAIQSALRNAVEQVMGTTVIGQSQLMDNEKAKSKVISQTAGNVKEYRIVKEDKDGVNYQIILNAKVEEKSILDNYAALVRSMGNPPFFIQTIDPDLRTALNGFFADLGFLVTTKIEDAQFIVNGNCQYLDVENDHYGKGIQIDLELTLNDKQSCQQLFSFRNEPRLTSTYSGNFNQIRQSAANKAFKTMRKKLHESLNKVVMDWVLNGREVTVVFKNVKNTTLDEILVKSISDVPCAKFQTRSRNDNTVVLNCSYIGPSADFEEFLRERMKKDLPQDIKIPQTKKIELNSIEFAF